MIADRSALGMGEIVPFGRRPIPPRACVLENKTHVRTFLAEMLDELGFITREAMTVDIRTMLRDFRPDLIVLGPLDGGPEVRSVMQTLRAQGCAAKVMLFGGRSSTALIRNYEFGEAAGLTMLPPLGTPFRDRDLHANLDCFLPVQPAPPLPVDVDEALYNGWLELWYKSKINPHSLVPRGAEALVRVRIPPGAWWRRPTTSQALATRSFTACRNLSSRGCWRTRCNSPRPITRSRFPFACRCRRWKTCNLSTG